MTSRVFLENLPPEMLKGLEGVELILMEDLMDGVGRWERLSCMLRGLFLPMGMLERACGAKRRVARDDVAAILFSSGSAGEPVAPAAAASSREAAAARSVVGPAEHVFAYASPPQPGPIGARWCSDGEQGGVAVAASSSGAGSGGLQGTRAGASVREQAQSALIHCQHTNPFQWRHGLQVGTARSYYCPFWAWQCRSWAGDEGTRQAVVEGAPATTTGQEAGLAGRRATLLCCS